MLVTERIKLAFGEDYEPYCKYMGPKFGSKDWYDLEVLTGAYKGKAACRRFTKSTEGTSNILINRHDEGIFSVYDDFWDYCREPGETPLQVAERMTVEVHPGFEVIAGLFRWGVLDYLDGAKGGFVGGWRMERLRDEHEGPMTAEKLGRTVPIQNVNLVPLHGSQSDRDKGNIS